MDVTRSSLASPATAAGDCGSTPTTRTPARPAGASPSSTPSQPGAACGSDDVSETSGAAFELSGASTPGARSAGARGGGVELLQPMSTLATRPPARHKRDNRTLMAACYHGARIGAVFVTALVALAGCAGPRRGGDAPEVSDVTRVP